MRVAHVTATYLPYQGGTGTVCFNNARELARLGHQVSVLTVQVPGAGPVGPEGVQVRRFPAALQIGNAPLMPALLGLKGFDLIHLHCPFIFGSEMIWAAARRTNTPYIVTHHNDLIGDGLRKPVFQAYSAVSSRLVYGGARKMAAVSLDHARFCRMAPLFQRRWSDVVEVPNGVDTELFRPGVDGTVLREKLDIPATAPVVLFVGALDRAHHFKGADQLIRAFSRVRDRRSILLVVGEGELRPGLERLAASLGVLDRTRFVGMVRNADLAPFYAAADLLVLPSFPPESFGLVLVEAMASGRPVIAHNIPGVRTLIRPGVDGFLAQPGQLDDLVEKIDRLVNDPSLRRQMGTAARARVEERYAWGRIGERLSRLYEEVVADG